MVQESNGWIQEIKVCIQAMQRKVIVLSSLCLSPPGGADWYHQTQNEMNLGTELP